MRFVVVCFAMGVAMIHPAKAQKMYEIPVSCESFEFGGTTMPCGKMQKAYLKSWRGVASFGARPAPSDILVIAQSGPTTIAFIGNAIRRQAGTLNWIDINRVEIAPANGGNPQFMVYGECLLQPDPINVWASINCVANDINGVQFSVALRSTGTSRLIDFNAPIYQDR